MPGAVELGQLLRGQVVQVLNAVLRRFGDFDLCEDAVQEAMLAAAVQWPVQGIPDNPTGWLISAASRRRIDGLRADQARREREHAAAALRPAEPPPVSGIDDTLNLFLLCCHPALTEASRVALTLRAVGGLTTAEIASALLVSEATVSQRILRAKKRIRDTGAEFVLPTEQERQARIPALLQVLYLVFNEGYTSSSGGSLTRVELTAEALRLVRQLHELLPEDGEVTGLLALMLLTDARRPARTRSDGAVVALAEQDRSAWDQVAIAEGTALLEQSLAENPIGPYQLQAAIAAVHDEAADTADTDWAQILGLYDLLRLIAPGPIVELNRIVALAMVHGPVEALAQLSVAEENPMLHRHYRVAAVRAHLLDQTGDRDGARRYYRVAARGTLSLPERRYLESKAAPEPH